MSLASQIIALANRIGTEMKLKMVKSQNLADVANRQTALNNLTDVASATNRHVLTKDPATGNALYQAINATPSYSLFSFSLWAANTAYAVGDKKAALVSGYYYYCICTTAHTSSASWDYTKWDVVTLDGTQRSIPKSAYTLPFSFLIGDFGGGYVEKTSAEIAAILAVPSPGTAFGTYCAGNDARLSDARPPTDNSANYAKQGNEFKGDLTITSNAIDWSTGWFKAITLTANTTYTFTNLEKGKTILLKITGSYTLTLPGSVTIVNGGTYDGTKQNFILLTCFDASAVLGTINKP